MGNGFIPWLVLLVYVATAQNHQKSEWSRLCAGCDTSHQSVCRHNRRTSASQFWCPRVCPSGGQWTSYPSTLERRSMAHTIVRCFWLKNYCLLCVRSVLGSLSFNKAKLIAWDNQPLGTTDTCVHFTKPLATQQHRSLTYFTTKYGEKCSNGSTKFMTALWLRLIDVWHDFEPSVIDYAIDACTNASVRVFLWKNDIWSI